MALCYIFHSVYDNSYFLQIIMFWPDAHVAKCTVPALFSGCILLRGGHPPHFPSTFPGTLQLPATTRTLREHPLTRPSWTRVSISPGVCWKTEDRVTPVPPALPTAHRVPHTCQPETLGWEKTPGWGVIVHFTETSSIKTHAGQGPKYTSKHTAGHHRHIPKSFQAELSHLANLIADK